MFGRKDIEDVFTPRNPEVNNGMYIQRISLEKELLRSIKGSMHSFLFGESGTGKSWLYKKLFADENIDYVVANCSNANRNGSIEEEIYSVCVKDGKAIETGYSKTKKGGVKLGGTAEISKKRDFTVKERDVLEYSFQELAKNSRSKPAVIVFDNLEMIFKSEALMSELSNIIILLDDARYAKHNIKFLIVGVPNQVLQYFSSIENPSSVGNRIQELSRVQGLDLPQVNELVEKGFTKYLKVDIPENDRLKLAEDVFNLTLGVPLRVHEYCVSIAYEIKDNGWKYNPDCLDAASYAWLRDGLRENYSIIEKYLNSEGTTYGRRNQVIYAIGKTTSHEFDTSTIGNIVSREFVHSAPERNSGIGRILSSLTKGDKPIIRREGNSNSFVVTDPRHLMCIRAMLYKEEESDKVIKKVFSVA